MASLKAPTDYNDKCFPSVFLSSLVRSHPALVNAIILILHSVTSSMPGQSNASSSHNAPASSYSEMPGLYRSRVKHMGPGGQEA